ncbi:hypothetical protein ACPF3S_001333 [Vibrio cholerae]|uniref:hypothetical protein n=1 Tax=Vibrio cholerae TaxID=666 RepID=UPI000E6D3A30|nr:hypothetical protein [Vibrio cholerae]EGQ8671036.1 hypothetical protein [Vibrio cholerae]EGQ9462814.1 hypothetical protein [Vibrio cholerae]EGR1328138.1 hypothetical protein [Vibrio cholerae]EGR1446717.1 hypothetical protein [Vibrio cholerae]EGR2319164.1 hypothetical protein [Vibrio cholerae]
MGNITIRVGAMQSVASVYFSSRKSLDEFNSEWALGHQPSVTWDLSQLKPGRVNVAAVAFLLALAHRIRVFTGQRQKTVIEWHPNLFSFLFDINFFTVSDNYDLFEWPFEIGGFEGGKTNPNTKVLAFSQLETVPDIRDFEGIAKWKKVHRENYRSNIIHSCEALFSVNENANPKNLPLIMSRNCAELVTNSLLWGDATPFIGLQRTRSNIFISVSDIGRGLRGSLIQKQLVTKQSCDDLYSIALACTINKNDFGLKRAIGTVVELGGNISISSGKCEINWGAELWRHFLTDIDNDGFEYAVQQLAIRSDDTTEASYDKKINGFRRAWPSSIRGTRVSFSIPLEGKLYK